MYGGLFGDLPAAKNSQIKQEESSSPVVAAVKKEEVAAVKKEEVEGAQTQAQPACLDVPRQRNKQRNNSFKM